MHQSLFLYFASLLVLMVTTAGNIAFASSSPHPQEERELGSKLLFCATTSVNLYEDEDGIPHAQHFRLYQVLSPLQALSYEIGLYGDTQPSYKMTDSQAIMRYRQRFFRDWLMLEISPRLTFPEEDNRQANPGIVAKLEATFGYQAGEGGYRKIFR